MLEYDIKTEDSSVHWKYFLSKDRNVLDLGCGRWGIQDPNEMSPIWILNNGAKHVIGVDASNEEIAALNRITETSKNYTFLNHTISSGEEIKDLIKKYSIDAIKSDIESGETHFLSFSKEDFMPIKVFAVEYHNFQIKEDFMKKLPEWGFTIVAHGKLYHEGVGVLFAEKNQ